MTNIKNCLDKGISFLCIVIFMFMTVLGTYQIVTRYVFNSPSTVSEELLTYSFTWLALLSAAYVFGKRDHMRMAFLVNRLSKKTQNKIAIISELIVIVFSALVLIYGGLSITKLTMTQQSASLGIPMGYVYSILPVCGIITIIYNIINIKSIIKEIKFPNKTQNNQ